jgi:zinc and cadmium transporter
MLGIAVGAIMLASLTGKLFTWSVFDAWLSPRLHYLVAFAAGVFVIVIASLLEEVVHEGLSLESVGAFMLGGVLLELMTRLLPKNTHHHHGPETGHEHGALDARRMLVGDGVHNIHDGLTLVPAFLVSPTVGITTATGILVHEMVQEVSEFFVLRKAGYSVRKALILNFVTSATILIGVALALFAASFEELVHLLVPFAAGGFFYVVVRDLTPSIVRHARADGKYVSYLASFAGGLLLMAAVSLLAPHALHEEPNEDFLLPPGFDIAYTNTSFDVSAV